MAVYCLTVMLIWRVCCSSFWVPLSPSVCLICHESWWFLSWRFEDVFNFSSRTPIWQYLGDRSFWFLGTGMCFSLACYLRGCKGTVSHFDFLSDSCCSLAWCPKHCKGKNFGLCLFGFSWHFRFLAFDLWHSITSPWFTVWWH